MWDHLYNDQCQAITDLESCVKNTSMSVVMITRQLFDKLVTSRQGNNFNIAFSDTVSN